VCTCDAKDKDKEYKELRETNVLCDVTLKVQGIEVPAHKIVLAAKSPYFRAMFTTYFSERQQNVIELDKNKTGNSDDSEDPSHLGLRAAEFTACIDFIYTGKFEINKSAEMETLVEIVKVANFLELSEIQEWVIDIVVNPNAKYLNYENMKMVSNLFGPYDYKNIIKETVRSEVVANWEDYIEEFPDDWEFVLTVWPDFKLPFKISTSESLDGLTKALRNINETALNQLRKDSLDSPLGPLPTIELAKSLKLFMCKNPESYFECRTKLEPSMRWIGTLDIDIIRDEGDVLIMTDILAKILKEKDQKNERASFAFPLHLMKNFGSIKEVRDALGTLIDNADVKLEFCQYSITQEYKKEQEIYCENDGPSVINDELCTIINNRLKEVNSMIMKRAETKRPPLQHLVVSQVDLTHLWKHCLTEIATESVYVTLKNINISLEFLEMFVHYIEKKNSSQNFPLRRISFNDCPLSEIQRRSVSRSLNTIACNLTEVDFSKSKLNASDLKELSVTLKAKAVEGSLTLKLLSLRSIDTLRCLQTNVFADLVCSAEIVDLSKSKIRPSQLKCLAERVFAPPPGTRLKRLGLMNFVLVHDFEMSDYEDFVVGNDRRLDMPEIHDYLAQLLALLEVCSFSGPSCNFISPKMLAKMKKMVMDLSVNKEEAKVKVGLFKITPKVNHHHDHDYQTRSHPEREESLNIYLRWQAQYWDIYKNKMSIPPTGYQSHPDSDRWTEEDGSEDEGLISESWSPKTEPPTEPSSPSQYNFDLDEMNENAANDEVASTDEERNASPNHLD